MTPNEKVRSFWVDDDGLPLIMGKPLEEEFLENGIRYRWAINERGVRYRKCIDRMGQVGAHLSPTYTLREYADKMKALAEAQIAAMPPHIREMLGHRMVEIQVEMMGQPFRGVTSDPGPEGGAIFI